MSTADDLAGKADPVEKFFGLIYSTAFRLTGNHQATALLVKKALRRYEYDGRAELAETIKSLCRAFFEDAAEPSRQPDFRDCGTSDTVNNTSRVQEALLNLDPIERTAVVLRDNLGLSYAEIAGVAMASEKDVAATIAAARFKLKNCLSAPSVV